MQNKFTLLLLPLLISGCISLDPEYKRPVNVIPNEAVYIEDTENKVIIEDSLYWKNYIQNEKLLFIVKAALENNKDLSIALSNIKIASERYGVESSNRFPNLNLDIGGQKGKAVSKYESSKIDISITSYEIDIVNRLKSLSTAALELYLNTEEARNAKEILIRSEVIKSYYEIAYYKSAYNISKQTEKNNLENLNLIEKRFNNGLSREKDFNDANSQYLKSKSDSLMYSTNINKSINSLNYIIGANVDNNLLPKGVEELKSTIKPLNRTLDSKILLNRPDILAAEHILRSKNANIGAARAEFFPRIKLTAASGIASNDLTGLFNNNYTTWGLAPSISIPIFDAGKNRSNLEIAKEEKEIAIKEYEKVLQKSFYELLDELEIKKTIKERLITYEKVIELSKNSYKLANKSYELGYSGYIDVLVAQQNLYNSQMQYLSLNRENFYNEISLYKVLGY